MVGLTGPASAAKPALTGPPAETPVLVAAPGASVQLSAVRSTRTAGGAITAATIVCTLNVQNPHNSSHVGGTVNVVVVLTCTSAVPYISIRAALYRNGGLVKDSGAKSVYNSRTAQNNAAVACSDANYRGWGSFAVTFPPGYAPPTGAGSGYGNQVYIDC